MKNVFKMTAIATSIMASSVAFAETTGTGTSTVDVDVPDAIVMTGLGNVDWDYEGQNLSSTQALTVCQNFGAGFTVTVSDTDLTDGTNTIAMSATGTEGTVAKSSDTIAACNAGTASSNASVTIGVLASDINGAPSGEYQGSVTVTVSGS